MASLITPEEALSYGLLTDHDDFDYGLVEEHAQYIFDTRNRCRGRVVERL